MNNDQIEDGMGFGGLVPSWKEKYDDCSGDLYEAKQRLLNAERILERLGYRRCDIPACNCNSYHKQQ